MRESGYLHADEATTRALMKIPTLRHFKSNLSDILSFSKIKQYKSGELIITEGERDKWIYCIISGAADVTKRKQKINSLLTGDIFGEMSIVDGSVRSASVRAITDTICLAYNAEMLGGGKKRRSEMLLFILYRIFAKMLADRLRQANEALVDARKELARLKGEDENTVMVDDFEYSELDDFFPEIDTFMGGGEE